ncbi:MAG: DUF4912 domain-containing protein [Campylobacterota bacterium]|nr:DUF4912 domain-containing protein [Campylobacterota bacterium]
MDNKLIEESLKSIDSYSSSVHAIDTIIADDNIVPAKIYTIPHRYYKSKVVLLPVSPERYYIYWEICDDMMSQFSVTFENNIYFRIVNENGEKIKEALCYDEVGEYFFNKDLTNVAIHVVVGFYKDSQFVTMMESKPLNAENCEIKISKDSESVWMKKSGGFTEIIRASLQHFTLGMSSKSYVEEIERLKFYENESLTNLSSHKLSLGDKND